jgi:hypothetical protein
MPKTHNKKRNVGIIFEQLIQHISDAIIRENQDQALPALNIIRKCFVPGSELYKEFRLFNALVKTKVSNSALAMRILSETKNASRSHNSSKLRKEKSALIREVNYTLKDPAFYSRHVNDYRNYATIQTLLNEWRKGDSGDLTRIIHYEEEAVNWLMKENRMPEQVKLTNSDDVNALTVRIMTEKFNKKYGAFLNIDQRELIKEYVFSLESNTTKQFISKLSIIKKQALNELAVLQLNPENEVLNEKIDDVIKKIHNLDLSKVNDMTVGRFLMLSKLKEELTEKING